MQTPLFSHRRFLAIFGAMAFASFNDNFYKNALIILLTYRLAEQAHLNAPMLISIASAAFIVPFFLFSGIAGTIADKYSKSHWVRVLKVVELGLYVVSGAALLSNHVTSMLVALFLLGTLSTFFGPVKYAILPELMRRDEILSATGMIEGGNYVSILIGTLLGALLVLRPHGEWLVTGVLMIVGVLGFLSAWMIPETKPASPELKINYNIFTSIWDMMKESWKKHIIFAAILGISWFWSIGAMYLTQLPVFTKEIVGANERVVSMYMGIFTVGIALGSVLCPKVVKIIRGGILSPLALGGIMITGLDLCFAGYGMVKPAHGLIEFKNYFHGFDHWRILVDLSLMSFCGGLFIVPLYALLQTDSGEGERARVIASNNVMNALFVAIASLMSAIFYEFHLEVREVLMIFALLNAPVIWLLWREPKLHEHA